MIWALAASVALVAPAPAETIEFDLNLKLILERTGYDNLTIYDEDGANVVAYYDFLSSKDNTWGIRPVQEFGFSVGQKYSLVAGFGLNPLSNCSLGVRDCAGAFGSMTGRSFSIGNGNLQTDFMEDFVLRGRTGTGDEVFLHTFTGTYYVDHLKDEAGQTLYIAEWNADAHIFSVIEGSLSEIPLPASLSLLMAGLGGFGLLGRRKRKVT